MSLIYVKGTPGSGKSAIKQELGALGYEAHDADDPDMGGPYCNASGERVTYPENPNEDWFSQHSYRLVPEAVNDLHNRARDKTIFLCGTAGNDDDLWPLFDRVVFLDASWKVIQGRLALREGNDYGKAKHELALIKEKYDKDQEIKTRPGVVVVDANRPLDAVLRLVLDQVTVSVPEQ